MTRPNFLQSPQSWMRTPRTSVPDAEQAEAPFEVREEIEAVIACLGDDAAQLRGENPEDERADNMDRAAELLEAMAAVGIRQERRIMDLEATLPPASKDEPVDPPVQEREALEQIENLCTSARFVPFFDAESEAGQIVHKVKELARAALATKPQAGEQEPVAWYRVENGMRVYYETKAWDDLQPLYPAAQPEQVAQDRERLDWLDAQCSDGEGKRIVCLPGGLRAAIDAARTRGEQGGAV